MAAAGIPNNNTTFDTSVNTRTYKPKKPLHNEHTGGEAAELAQPKALTTLATN